jgi:hypothetical protein
VTVFVVSLMQEVTKKPSEIIEALLQKNRTEFLGERSHGELGSEVFSEQVILLVFDEYVVEIWNSVVSSEGVTS